MIESHHRNPVVFQRRDKGLMPLLQKQLVKSGDRKKHAHNNAVDEQQKTRNVQPIEKRVKDGC